MSSPVGHGTASRTIVCVLAIFATVLAFYSPTWFLLPDPDAPRWTVWMLGYACGFAVIWIGRVMP